MSQSQDVGSQISAGGNLTLSAGQDLNAKAASVSAGQALNVSAGDNINISEGQASQSLDEAHKTTSKGFLSSTTTTTRNSNASNTAVGSSFEGQSVSITAGQDLSVKGSNVLADQNVDLQAGGSVKIEAAQNTQSQSSFKQTNTSGVMSGGGIGFTVGSRMQSADGQGTSTTAAGSTIGSTGGNVTINAGGAYTQTGSDVLTPKGDIAISAQKVDINEARETGSQSTEQKFKQSGVTVAITSPVLSAVQTAASQLQAAGNTSSGRMQLLAAANAGFNLKQGADAIKGGQGDANGQVPTGNKNPDGTPEMKDANAADKAGGIGISISAGASSSQSKQQSSADSAKGSNLNAGGNVTIQATGAGKDSDITVRGSSIEAGKATSLKADDQVNIVAAQNTTTESSNSSSKSGSVGVAIQLGAAGGGIGFTASASKATGQGAGNSTTYTNSQVAGNTVTIESGGDTTIRGGVVKADQVTAKVGGNLNIESLQDKSQYKEKSQQVGGSVTVGPAAGGSVNVGQTKINSDFLSVGEQSAIRAGAGGFDVSVNGKTHLTGGQITSTQAAIDNNKNSYVAREGTTTTDVQNSAKYSAQSISVGIAAGSKAPGAALSTGLSGVGIGSDKGSAQSTTTAGISGVAGNTSARTGDKETGLTAIFDKDKVQKEVAAQVAITSEFGKQASKIGGTEADKQRDALKAQANAETDPDKKAALQAESAKWEEGGAYRVAMHTVIGGLTGGTAGAVGAGAGSAAAPTLNELQSQLETGLQKAGLGESASKVIAGLAGGTTAAAIGTAASGGSVAGGATAFNADMNNRQLHPTEKQRIKEMATDKARSTCRGDADCEKKASVYWTDMLERAAEGRVDTQEAGKNQAYYEKVIAASGKPGSEASLGLGELFFKDLGEAQRMLNAEAGAPILDARGRPIKGTDGKPQTFFSATQAQRDNPDGNVFPGGSPKNQVSIELGKEQRDQTRLERLNTPSGQTVPDTTLEELLFGWRLPTKGSSQGAQAAGRAWESSKVLDAGEIAMSNGGNISAQQITRVGTPAGLNAAERNTLSNLDSLNSGQAGAVREHVSNSYFERNGFQAMDGKCGGSNCFDGVYIKGDQVIVNEVKPLNADGSIKLSPAQPSGLPAQGTIQWVESRARELIRSGDPEKVKTGNLILAAKDSGNLTTVVSGVNSNSMVIVKVKP